MLLLLKYGSLNKGALTLQLLRQSMSNQWKNLLKNQETTSKCNSYSNVTVTRNMQIRRWPKLFSQLQLGYNKATFICVSIEQIFTTHLYFSYIHIFITYIYMSNSYAKGKRKYLHVTKRREMLTSALKCPSLFVGIPQKTIKWTAFKEK